MKKKLIAILLAALLLVTLFPITALADNPHVVKVFDEATKIGGYRVRIWTSTATTTETEGGTIADNRNWASTLRSQGSWTFTASPKTGYEFDGWSYTGPSGAFSVSGANNQILTIRYVDNSQNYHATANFHQVQTFTLTTAVSPSGGGTIGKSPDQSTFTEGYDVVLTARPSTGWNFDGWTGDVTSSTNPLTVDMNSGKSIIANFSQIDYTVTFAPGDFGTLSGKTSYVLHYNDPFPTPPTINPIAGYTAKSWSLPSKVPEGGGTYTAQYSAIPYTVTFAAGAGGTLSGKTSYTDQNYYSAFPVAPTPVANDGYTFANWSSDFPDKVYTGGTYTANFNFTGYTVNLDLGAGGTFNSNSSSAMTLTGVPAGALSIPAYTIKDGYRLTGWSGSTNISGSTTLTARYEYRVTFVGNDQITITGTNPVWTSGPNVTAPAYTVASSYRFDGWDRSLSGITGPTTITAKAAVRQCTLTLLVSNGNYGYVWDPVTSRSYTYDAGTTVDLGDYYPWSVTGYFVRWVEKGTGVKYYSYHKNITLTGDTTYTAVFELGRYDQYVYTSAGANGKLNNDLSGSYASETRINLNNAQPAATTPGYEFKYWEEYIESTDAWVRVSQTSSGEAWVTVGEVNDYRAIFGLIDYTIDTTVTHGSITPDQTVHYGDDSTITYTADAHYHLASVTVDGVAQDITTCAASYTFTDVAASHTINVVFTIDTNPIDTTVAHGTIIADQTVDYGSDQTITYSADAHYHLASVTVDGVAQDIATCADSYTFANVTAAHTIEVVYAIDTNTIDTTVTQGTITADQTVDYDSSQTITYSADAHYHLASVTVDGVAQDIATCADSYTFANVIAGHTIEVVYTIDTNAIDTTVTNGTITADQAVDYDGSQTISYSADAHYHLASVTVDGVAQDIATCADSYTFANVTAAHTIEVVYAIDTNAIDTTVTHGTITADQTVDYGSSQKITYTADAHYHLVSVTVDGVAQDIATYADSYTFTNVTAGHTIVVLYAIDTYTVTFADYNGTALNTQTVNWDAAATAPANPSREGYDFTGWDKTFGSIKADTTVTALYTIKTYTVSFYRADGTTQIGTTQTVNWGSAAAFETAPARTGYAFDQWVLTGNDDTVNTSLTNVRENITAVASYLRNGYTVTFVDYNGDVIGTDGVLYGNAAVAPEVPAREGYTFTGWDTSFDPVTSNLTVTAQYSINTYTVTFADFDGTVLDTQTVDWNTAAAAPAQPSREGFMFTGWDTAFDAVNADITITAQYEEIIVAGDEEIPDTGGTIQDEPVPAAGGFAWWWIPIIIGGVAVLFFLIFFVARRKKKEEENA